jgi:Domain of unknown function (DUF4340)
MSVRRLAILSAVVVALFAFIFFFERHQPTTQERLEKGDVVWDVNEGKIAKITIVRGSETVEFARGEGADEHWKIVKPEAYLADEATLSTLVTDLARPVRQGEAPESAGRPDYGLMSPRAVVTVAARAEKGARSETHSLSVGREIPGTDTVAARMAGADKIVFLRSTLAAEVLKPEESYRSRRIFTGSPNDASKVSIARGRGRLEFEKRKTDWWMTRPTVDLADSSAVTRLLNDLLAENVIEFVKVPAGDLAGAGLAPPISSVSVLSAGKAETLEIGATRSDGKSLYARASGQVFAIEPSITDELSKEADAYREPHLFRFEPAGVSTVAITLGATTSEYRKQGTVWKAGDKPVPETAVTDLLNAIAGATAKDFRPPEAGTAPAPLGYVKIDLASGGSWTARFRAISADRVGARVPGRPDEIEVPRADFDRIAETAKKIVPTPKS